MEFSSEGVSWSCPRVGLRGDPALLVRRRVLPAHAGPPARAEPGRTRPTSARSPLAERSARPVPVEHPGGRRSRSPDVRRSVGEAVTESKRQADGWVELTSRVSSTRAACSRGRRSRRRAQRPSSRSTASIGSTPRATCSRFDVDGPIAAIAEELLTVDGQAQGRDRWRSSRRGPLPILNQTLIVPLRAAERGPERARAARPAARPAGRPALGDAGRQPADRAGRAGPGRGRAADADPLGQRARSRPSRSCSTCRPLSARTWVRPDGLVLRQEVPFPFVKLILERQPDRADRSHEPEVPGSDDRAARRDQDVRAEARRRRPRPERPGRRAVRLPRAQRRGQDDDDQDGLRPARPDLGRRSGSAAIPATSQRGPPAPRPTSPTSPTSTRS